MIIERCNEQYCIPGSWVKRYWELLHFPPQPNSPKEKKKGETEFCMKSAPLHEVQGFAPGGIPAFSNGSDTTFTNQVNQRGELFLGFQWQCVEFARRWLLERKGLLLPEVHFAAHIAYLTEVHQASDLTPVPITVHINGSAVRPLPDTLIVYPSHRENFVGHVGVITEVGADFVSVADQNRLFHSWGDKPYSARYPLLFDPENGNYTIDDPECKCVAWIAFPVSNRDPGIDGAVVVQSGLRRPVVLSVTSHLSFFARGMTDLPSKFAFVVWFTRVASIFFVRQGVQWLKGCFGSRRNSPS